MHITQLTFLLIAMAAVALSVGCQSAHEDHDHIVYFHKPADVKHAVARLTEIHKAMLSAGPLPPPQEFETHGSGHHHHSHGDHGHDHDHDHDHEHDHEHEHEIVSVGIFEEWCDVVRWLPSIAANSDMNQTEWDQINAGCKSLSSLVSSLSGNQSDAEKRKIYVAHEQEIQQMLQTVGQAVEAFEQTESLSPYKKDSIERQDTHG